MIVGQLNKPYYDEQGYDAFLVNEEHRIFGVFDGMGTSEGARSAAKMASVMFFKRKADGLDASGLGATIDDISKSIAVHYPTDGTTVVIVRIDSEDRLHWACIGDSRLYVMHGKRVKQVTADEGVGNRLLNYCGPYTHGCCQIGVLDDDQWDSFMICSDGITGDWKEQLIRDEMIEMILNEFDPQDAAHELCKISKKDDDKTVIVVRK